jgi:hypothetical protein
MTSGWLDYTNDSDNSEKGLAVGNLRLVLSSLVRLIWKVLTANVFFGLFGVGALGFYF